MKSTSLAAQIRLIVSDVDGVWTDGRIAYIGDQREIKEFHVRDGLAVKIAQRAGLPTAVITSRRSQALERRCQELGVEELIQNAGDKLEELVRLSRRLQIEPAAICYIGDDLPDLSPIAIAGISAAPSDAAAEVLEAVDWRLETAGGAGVFRELVERLLRERGEWKKVVQHFSTVGSVPNGHRP